VRHVLPAILLAIASFVPLAGLTLQPPALGRTAAVVFAPGTDFPKAVAALATVGAAPVRNGAWANVVVADFGRIRRFSEVEVPGAWALLDPVAIGGCFGVPEWAAPDAPLSGRTRGT